MSETNDAKLENNVEILVHTIQDPATGLNNHQQIGAILLDFSKNLQSFR